MLVWCLILPYNHYGSKFGRGTSFLQSVIKDTISEQTHKQELSYFTDIAALVGMLMSSSKLFLFTKEAHLNSGVRLLLELYCVIVIKLVTFFTIFAKLTMAFTFTGLTLNFYSSVSGCGSGFGFEQKYWRIDGFGEKKARIGGFAYPFSPPSLIEYAKVLF